MKTDKQWLIVVDYQNGFIPKIEGGTGELWVEGGWLLAPVINELMKETKRAWGLVIATRDWHPEGHMSFASNYSNREVFDTVWWEDSMNSIPSKPELADKAEFSIEDLQIEFGAWTWAQVLWPDHCIAGTPWAEYFDWLDLSRIDRHVIKWYDPKTEMYSWFFGKEKRDDEKIVRLTDILKEAWVSLVRIVGLATDYCVNATALDALKNGFDVEVIKKAIAGVSPEDSVKRLEELREKWAIITE